jgi:glycosyltransferase involved in cell wall biosynthesis
MGFRRYPDWREISLEGTRLARAVIAISRQVASDAMALYDIPPERVKLIMNGFDESIFHTMNLDRAKVLRSFGIDNLPEVVITFVGKLTSFKGVDVLLEAASIYESRLGDAMTLIVGDGDLHDRLLSQSKSLGLKDVRFLGHQPQPKIARLLNISNLSVVPSRVEPFGLVAVEALACGTPVIATNEGGLVDFVDERVGWLVDVDDPDQLSDAIIEAIRSDAKTNKGPVAASYAIESFSWSRQVDKMISVYREVLGD